MIVLDNVTKAAQISGHPRTVLSAVNLAIPANRRIALLGNSTQEKRVLLDVLAGIGLVKTGRITRNGRVSFPVGSLGGFSAKLAVRENVSYVARIYGLDPAEFVAFMEKMANIGEFYARPFREMPFPARLPFAQVMGLSMPFDTYVFADEKFAGTPEQQRKCRTIFDSRMKNAGAIIPVRDPEVARERCDMALLLHDARLWLFDAVEDGLDAFSEVALARPVD